MNQLRDAYFGKPVKTVENQEFKTEIKVLAWQFNADKNEAPPWIIAMMNNGKIAFATEGFAQRFCMTVQTQRSRPERVNSGDWVILRDEGDIEVVSDRTFKERYVELNAETLDFKDRVRKEHADLVRNIDALNRFINVKEFSVFMGLVEPERHRMYAQLQCMRQLADILQQRIDNF